MPGASNLAILLFQHAISISDILEVIAHNIKFLAPILSHVPAEKGLKFAESINKIINSKVNCDIVRTLKGVNHSSLAPRLGYSKPD